MAYRFGFCDNESYTAENVNAITKRLVTSGVADVFLDGVANSVEKFNEIGAQLYTDGVVGEKAGSLKVTKTAEGSLHIAPGTAFFKDGAVFEVADGGQAIAYTRGVLQYVFLQNKLQTENRCYPACSAEAPTGDFVLLATVTAEGVVEDKRVFAKGKLPGYEAPVIAGLCITDSVDLRDGDTVTKTYEVGNGRITHVMAVSYNETDAVCGVWRKDGVAIQNDRVSKDGSIMIFRKSIEYALADFTLHDGVLTVRIRYHNDSGSDSRYYVPFTLYLF